MHMKIVEAKGLSKEYKALKREGIFNDGHTTVPALMDFSLEIDKPTIFGLVGPNGAGKTTFIKLCLGLIKPTAGGVQVLDFIPYQKDYGFLRHVGFVSGQKQSLEQFLPAQDSLLLAGLQYGLAKKEIEDKISQLANSFNVAHKLSYLIRELSLGERMKFELIASIMHSPKLLFLDEPTLGLDFESRNALYEIIRNIHQHENATVFLTSHHLHDITSLCQRVAIINSGHKIFEGTVEQILSLESQDSYMSALIKEMEKYSK